MAGFRKLGGALSFGFVARSLVATRGMDLWSLGASAFEFAALRLDLAAAGGVAGLDLSSGPQPLRRVGAGRGVGVDGGAGVRRVPLALRRDVRENLPRLERRCAYRVHGRAGVAVAGAGGGMERPRGWMEQAPEDGIAGRFVRTCDGASLAGIRSIAESLSADRPHDGRTHGIEFAGLGDDRDRPHAAASASGRGLQGHETQTRHLDLLRALVDRLRRDGGDGRHAPRSPSDFLDALPAAMDLVGGACSW